MNTGRRPTPQEIAEILRERIRGGRLKAGDRLPTQAELADEFGVERGTVRQALRALQDDGLLTNVSKGSPPRIAQPAPHPGEPQPALVVLGPRLSDAFREPRVRLDVVCHTAESLLLALSEPLRQIHEGRVRPDSLDLRVLMPARDIALAFPVLADPAEPGAPESATAGAEAEPVPGQGPVPEPDDPAHRRWLQMRNAQARVLRHSLHALRSTHGIAVKVSFRALPFTPPVKLYLLNGEEALLGYYLIARREEEWEDRTFQTYDALGTQSLLFSFRNQAAPRDAAFVTESQKWFDALWDTITTDMTLS
ncbi:winged helix-turn-helix transcriptional regulator [Streptomyces sp. RG38]|uniref:Winged helix-turn-helix transcriptional regulator n=1 Tax=Streptomyces tagetis TaxID=2820809 RepID=A0A940XTA0_9ACTN|nr:winged helix-turn-helix transcriptional regulator [Streptomyces sp. RG38]